MTTYGPDKRTLGRLGQLREQFRRYLKGQRKSGNFGTQLEHVEEFGMEEEGYEAAVEESDGLGVMDAEGLMETLYQGMKFTNRLQTLGCAKGGKRSGTYIK